MTTTQLFFALTGVIIPTAAIFLTILIKYLEAKLSAMEDKIDSLVVKTDMLLGYMISHEGRIAILEDRSKNK
jgi:hypothetical protein